MNKGDSTLELKVGSFVLVGILVVAMMVLKFGRMGQTFDKTYEVRVELPDAGGLIKDADVKLSGVKVGVVAEKPKVSTQVNSVTVVLKINEGTVIPRKMSFQVGSSGLLGDKFVEIAPGEGFDPGKFDPKDSAQVVQPGETIKGAPAGGLDALTRKGQVVMDQLTAEIEDLRQTTAKINEGILSDANQKNLTEMLANLNATSSHFVNTSKGIDTVVKNAQGVVDGARQTMATANQAMVTTKDAAGDLRLTLDEARKTIASLKGLIQKATQGDGVVATLLSNRELSENLQALVANLRQHGLLFYKDVREKPGAPREPRGRQ